MKIILLGIVALFCTSGFSQIRPIPNRITVTPEVKKRYKNLSFNGAIFEAPGKLKNPLNFMLDPNVGSDLDIKKFSQDTQKTFSEFIAEVAKEKDGFKNRHFKKLLKSLGGDLASADIEALIYIVMMEATKSMDQDLRTLMEEVKNTNKQKEEARKSLVRLRLAKADCMVRNCQVLSVKDLDTLESKVKSQLDSISDMSEPLQMRLQAYMERRTKLLEILSNIMKKTSDTASSITSNLK